MGKYLDILARAEAYDKNDRNDKSPALSGTVVHESAPPIPFGRLSRFGRILSALEARRPHRPLATRGSGRQPLPRAVGRASGGPWLDDQGLVRVSHRAGARQAEF